VVWYWPIMIVVVEDALGINAQRYRNYIEASWELSSKRHKWNDKEVVIFLWENEYENTKNVNFNVTFI